MKKVDEVKTEIIKNHSLRKAEIEEGSGVNTSNEVDTQLKLIELDQSLTEKLLSMTSDYIILPKAAVVFSEDVLNRLSSYSDLLSIQIFLDDLTELCIKFENKNIDNEFLSKIRESFIIVISTLSPAIGLIKTGIDIQSVFSKNYEALYEEYRNNRISDLTLLKAYLEYSFILIKLLCVSIDQANESIVTLKVKRELLLAAIQNIKNRYP